LNLHSEFVTLFAGAKWPSFDLHTQRSQKPMRGGQTLDSWTALTVGGTVIFSSTGLRHLSAIAYKNEVFRFCGS
jgi:hypothetical protein